MAGLKMHPFFRGMDWVQRSDSCWDPPFVPALKDPLDTQNFDKFSEQPDSDKGETYRAAAADPQATSAFEGYTFNRPPTIHAAGMGVDSAEVRPKPSKFRPAMGADFFTPPS